MSVVGWPSALWFVRHGESVGNVANTAARHANTLRLDIDVNDARIALTERGATQATSVGRWIRQLPPAEWPTQVVASPYVRTTETARLISEAAGLTSVRMTLDERLRDREQGVLDRLTTAGFRDAYPDEAARREYLGKFWYRPAGGESWADVALRLRAVLLELRLTMSDERVLLVTHDVVILVARYILEGLSPTEATQWSGQLRNCSLTAYRRAPDGQSLLLDRFNDATALDGLAIPSTSNG